MTQDAAQKGQEAFFSSFDKKKNNRDEKVMEEAQRLVNLYRNISLLGDNFLDTFNEMILKASSEVLMALNDIIGGPTVRHYYDYLKNKNHPQEEDDNETEGVESDQRMPQKGYLPSPEQDPVIEKKAALNTESIFSDNEKTSESMETFFKKMMDIHHTEIEKQNNFMKQALEHIQSGINTQIEEQKKDTTPLQEALVEQQRKQIVLLNRTVEKLVQSQTDVLLKTFQKFNQNTRDIAEKQTERILKMIHAKTGSEEEYTDIIEAVPPVIEASDTNKLPTNSNNSDKE